MSKNLYRNDSGAYDPTAGQALSNVLREYKEQQKRVWQRQHELKTRPKVYIVSRYAGDVAANTEAAIRYCRYAIDKGKLPIASHLLYPQVLDDGDAEEREMGLMFGLSLLACCREVWVFGDTVSSGMQQEINEAKRLKKKIRFIREVV